MKLVKSILLALVITITFSFKSAETKRYNVLWLDLEDLSPHFDFYGDYTIETPNISRLAKEGIVFDKAYACTGVCAPSRASIITGMFPSAIGAHNMRIESKPNFPNIPVYEVVPPTQVRCFPDILRENGIYTICSNKTDYQFKPSPFTWDEYSKNDEIDRYELPKQRPFFKQINFWETHESQIWSWCRTNVPLLIDSSKVKVPPYLPQTAKTRGDWIAQYNNLKFVDHKIGKILKMLEDNKELENTIIILTGDHGDGLPRSKRTVYETGLRVPLIIRMPNKKLAGKRNDNLVYLMDLGPTILNFYGIKTPEYMHGKDLLGNEKRKYGFYNADRFDEKYDCIRAVNDGRFKYIKNFYPEKEQFINIKFRKNQEGVKELYLLDSLNKLSPIQKTVMRKNKPAEELFDLKNDPWELNNLATQKEYKDKLLELRTALNNWMVEINDKGLIPETEIANQFWPNKVQPITPNPNYIIEGSTIKFISTVPGVTVSYKTKLADSWKIYTEPFQKPNTDSLYFVAHRLGWKTSDILNLKLN
ncbi:MAG: sulfatase [Bacteroidota bacterium]|nr:sulfatase [Bacteroidota bacterium]